MWIIDFIWVAFLILGCGLLAWGWRARTGDQLAGLPQFLAGFAVSALGVLVALLALAWRFIQ